MVLYMPDSIFGQTLRLPNHLMMTYSSNARQKVPTHCDHFGGSHSERIIDV